MAYAVNTKVPVDRSQAEIRKILSKYGADGFAYAESVGSAMIGFQMAGRHIRFKLPMPKPPDRIANVRGAVRLQEAHEQLVRAKWRALVLAIKAKLECVDSGITTLEQEFMAHILLPNGSTVGEQMIPQIQQSYADGKMPPLLGFSGES